MKLFVGVKPTRQHMQALLRCKLPENEALLSLFRERLDEVKQALVAAEDTIRIHRLQGRAEMLIDFLEAVEKSPEILDRISK